MENQSQPATHNPQLLTRNPYVGPRAFEAADRANFFGRDAEIRQLANLVVAQRAVLLYSPSGAGKSSLINAGLIPTLQRRRMTALPIARVGGSTPSEATNPFVFNLLSSLADETVTPEALLDLSLREGLSPSSPLALDVTSGARLLVLDQFEELFTLHPGQWAAREDFFVQLQVAMEAFPHLGLLLAMREEYLAYLDSFSGMLPDRLRARFRLDLLGKPEARLAIQVPARAQGVDFTDAAATKLVNDLCQVQEQTLNGATEQRVGQYVEPVQLQVVCRQLWERVIGATGDKHPTVVILESDVETVGDVDAALATYYAETMTRIAANAGDERAIREWCQRLITPQGLRGIVLREEQQSGGLDNALVAALEDAHLVRAEKRAGRTWYELAHDRLVTPVQNANAAWLAEHLNLLQRQAALWDGQKRPDGLLLSGNALVEAEAWAKDHAAGLTDIERDFLTACQEAQARVRREQVQNRRIQWLAVGATVLMVVALVTAFFAWGQMQRAELAQHQAIIESRARATAQAQAEKRGFEAELAQATAVAGERIARSQQEVAQSRQIAAIARSELDTGNAERALLLAMASYGITHTVEAMDMIQQSLSGWRGREVLPDHQYAVYGATPSCDGKLVATVDETIIHLWSIREHKKLSLHGHRDMITNMQFNFTSDHLATVSVDGTVRLWDTQSGQEIWQKQYDGPLFSLDFSHDGKILAVAEPGGKISIWDVTEQKNLITLEAEGWGEPQSMDFSPNGRFLAVAYHDSLCRIWDLQNTENVIVFAGHKSVVRDIGFSPDGKIVASVGDDQAVRLWNPVTGEQISSLDYYEGLVGVIAFSPDGQYLAVGSFGGVTYLWDITRPEHRPALLTGHKDRVNTVEFSPDGRYLATASWDRTARVWDLRTHALFMEFVGHTDRVWKAIFTPDGDYLVTTSSDKTARLWDLRNGGEIATYDYQDITRAVAYASDEKTVMSVHPNAINIWNIETNTNNTLPVKLTDIRSAIFSPNHLYVAVVPEDGGISLIELSTGKTRARINTPGQGIIYALSFTPGEEYILYSQDRYIRIWDIGLNREVKVLDNNTSDIYDVVFSPDGRLLATTANDEFIRIWDWKNQQMIREFHASSSPIWAVAFSQNGQYLAVALHTGEVQIWDLFNDQLLVSLNHKTPIRKLQFSPNCSLLAVGGEDGIVYLWDWKKQEVVHFKGHQRWITGLVFDSEGRYLVTSAQDGTVRVWPVYGETVITLACERVTRDLSEEEWQTYIKGREYQPVCPEQVYTDWLETKELPSPNSPILPSDLLPAPSPPTIYYFEAIPGTTIEFGESVVLRWDLYGAKSAFLLYDDKQDGVVSPNEISISPETTTTYRLVAFNGIGQSEKEVTINVIGSLEE